ncbi:hypothetical protein [Acinetobacter guillouiae]|uniref:hypothetical protein n=1 Tax=Acinetobacter guillouiae TaxID=106649 RepID=UPI001CD1F0EB|nr:hypothetical protein [Acinetobacter guillouiae]
MTLKDSVQTAILVVGFFSLLVFGACYYFVLIDPDSSNYPLKEALSITASFFGGFATLTAAFIASRLFNDWRHQHNIEIRTDSSKEILKLYEDVFYEMLTFDNYYNRSQFELKRILSKNNPNQQLIKITKWQFKLQEFMIKKNSEKQIYEAKIVYKNLEQSINTNIQGIEDKLKWILFKTSTLTVFINEPSLLKITSQTLDSIQEIMSPLRTGANKNMSSREFDAMYKKIGDDTIALASKNANKVVLILKKYIEA